jgi:hypothetical protein
MDQRDSTSDRRLLLAGLGLAGAAAIARVAKAGPLTPPPGPISPTGASVAQLSTKISPFDTGRAEPRRPITDCPSSAYAMYVISQPGAYYLTGNIDAQPGKMCISIECDHVDLDGDGFTINGVQGMSSAVASPPGVSPRCIEIYDVAYRQCQCPSCIDLRFSPDVFVSDCLFDQCVCPGDSTGPGAVCRCGPGSEVCDCDVRDCEGASIAVSTGSTIEDCTCMGGSGGAYRCADRCCVDNCAVVSHSGVGITCDDGCTVCDCECRSCTGGPAIVCGNGCVMEGCLSHSSGGMLCLSDCTCDDCDVLFCTGTGLACGDRCSVSDFSWRQVAGAAMQGGHSISMDNSDLELCQDGVSLGDNSSVSDCTARQITGASDGTGGVGIQCGSSCSVQDCDLRSCASAACVCGDYCSLERCASTACQRGYVAGHYAVVLDCDGDGCSDFAIQCGDGSCVSECDMRGCGGVSCLAGSRCVIECCTCLDGSSHAISCGTDCCVDDCDVSNCNGYGVFCGQRTTVCACRHLFCWGISADAQCVITENELTNCDGSGGGGGGGAITLRGPRCQADDNTCSSCNIGVCVLAGAEGCCCDGNQIFSPSVAAMVVDASVASCLCTDNACTGAPPGAVAFVFGSASHGPVVVCQGGDISAIPASSHHCANWVY